jgi:hypothetical protein
VFSRLKNFPFQFSTATKHRFCAIWLRSNESNWAERSVTIIKKAQQESSLKKKSCNCFNRIAILANMNTVLDAFHLKKKLLLFLFVSIVVIRLVYYACADGFSLNRIACVAPKEGNELPPPTQEQLQEIKEICSNRFSYLGKGFQAYVFISQDKKHVLKLFKYYHIRPVSWLKNIPLPYPLNSLVKFQLDHRQNRCDLTLQSYKITHDLIPDECGLVYLQIAPSNSFHQNVTLTDRIGRTYTIDLANYGFMIQKKADLIYPTIEAWLEKNEIDEAKKFIHSLVTLLVKRNLKGVQDQDPDLHKNAGVIAGSPAFIDVGSFHLHEAAKRPRSYVNDLKKVTRHFHEWLASKSPELAGYLQDEISALSGANDQEVCVISQNTEQH